MSGTKNATRILPWSEMNPMMAGQIAPPIIDATRSEDPSFVYRPSCLMLSAKMVGNMIEWKKPIRTTAHKVATPEPKSTTQRQIRVEIANKERILGGATRFITYEPENLPTMNPFRCSFKYNDASSFTTRGTSDCATEMI